MYMWRFWNPLNNARRDNIRHVHACLNVAILVYSAFLSGLMRGSEANHAVTLRASSERRISALFQGEYQSGDNSTVDQNCSLRAWN